MDGQSLAWEKLHEGTKGKIKSIKDMIAKKKSYKAILNAKWLGQEEKKEAWFEKFNAAMFFTPDELKALNMKVEEDQVEEDLVKQDSEDLILPGTFEAAEVDSILAAIPKMSDTQRLSFISNPVFLEKIVRMMVDYKESKSRQVLSVPDECRTAPVIVRSMRVSEQFYDAFSEVCKANNITLTVGLNLALLEFAEKYKK